MRRDWWGRGRGLTSKVRRGAVVVACAAVLMGSAVPAFAGGIFVDDDGSVHEDNIDLLAANNLAQGCAPQRFCPGRAVTRAQMATFLVRMLGLQPSSSDHFDDDDGNVHEGNINALVDAGVTSGVGGGEYRPADAVSRGQMASFLTRVFELDPAPAPFPDVGGTHADAIGAVHAAGIAGGYPDGTFRPGASVSRAQMASFLIGSLQTTTPEPPSAPGAPPELPEPPAPPSPPETSDTLTAMGWTLQRTGTLYCNIGSGEGYVSGPTIHATGWVAWMPIFFYYGSDNALKSYAYGSWEYSHGSQPTGIIPSGGTWTRADGSVGAMQYTRAIPYDKLAVAQWIYDYDTGNYNYFFARSLFGNQIFCTT